jgi:hypothetical protein
MNVPDPWQWLASMTDVTMMRAQIPEPGRYYHARRLIVIREGLLISEERAVLWHELVHAKRGDERCGGKIGLSVDREAARRAMPWPVFKWGIDRALDLHELVDLMKVDERLVRVRLNTTHPSEAAYIARRQTVYEETA